MSIFDAINLPVFNGNFDQSTNAPPPVPGWNLGGPSLSAPTGLSYDTVTPYEGVASLLVYSDGTSSDIVGLTSPVYPAKPGQIFAITGACRVYSGVGIQAYIQISFLDTQGNYISTVFGSASNSTNTWELVSARATAPVNAASAFIILGFFPEGGNGYVEFDAISLTMVPALNYYLSLFTSEYQNADTFLSWAMILLQPFVDLGIAATTMYQNFDISAAVGAQLDTLGTIVGVSRNLPFQPTSGTLETVTSNAVGSGYTVGDILTIVQAGASGGQIEFLGLVAGPTNLYRIVAIGENYVSGGSLATTGGTGSGATVNIVATGTISPILDDAHYLTLLLATIARNQWNGQIDSLYAIWQTLFLGGRIIVQDNMNMTATIVLAGTFDSLYLDIIENGLIIPRPQGVQYTYDFAELPVFGVDQNNTYVAGADLGHAA